MAKRLLDVALLAATAIASIASGPATAQEQASKEVASAAGEAPRAVTDSVTRFSLENGLKVIVQTSDRVPLVSAAVVYDVGSKDEQAGQHGYAHLFEHLALGGSAHWNQDALRSLHDMGATQINAQTTRDSTTFLETYPRAALERVLFLEADRMGFIGAALTSERIAREVDIVLNEIRLRAAQPFGAVDAVIHRDLYQPEHPYHHTVAGKEADLRSVTVEAARQWFDTYYGPSNATLILAGDVTGAEARELVARYFGGLEPRLPVDRLQTHAPRLSGPIRREMFDAVSSGRLYLNHLAPPAGSPEIAELDLTAQIMANGARSRLSRRLVTELGLASSAFATFEIGTLSSVMGFVVDGIDPADMPRVESEVDAILARFAAEGPTPAELASAGTARIEYLRNLQNSTSGKAFLQAQGARQNQVSDFAESYLAELLSATVESVRRVASDVYGTPGHRLSVLPRPPLQAVAGGYDLAKGPPALGPITPIAFPAIEEAQLSNGLKVVLVPREGSLPNTMLLRFEEGGSAGPSREIARIALARLAARGKTPDQLAYRERIDALNGWLNESVDLDHADIVFGWDSSRLAAGIALFGETLSRSEIGSDALAGLKTSRIDQLKAESVYRGAGPQRALYTAIYGESHPYAPAASTAEAVDQIEQIDPAALETWMRTHLDPGRATLYVAADTDMANLKPLLEQALGGWTAGAAQVVHTPIPAASGRPVPSLTVLDRPGAAQTYILAGKVIPAADAPDTIDAAASVVVNEIYGGNLTSRIGTNLRGEKGWTYGIGSGLYDTRGERRWIIAGSVDRDRSGASIAELAREMRALTAERPPEQAELDRIVTTAANKNAARLENNTDLLTAIADAHCNGLPYDDVVRQPMRLSALSIDEVRQAATAFADRRTIHWVVVGDWDRIRDQFEDLKLGEPVVIEPAN